MVEVVYNQNFHLEELSNSKNEIPSSNTPSDEKAEGEHVKSKELEPQKQSTQTSFAKRINRRYLGILCAFIAAIMYSLSALLIKILNYHPCNLGVWRFSVMFVITLPFYIHGQFFQKTGEGSEDSKGILHQVWPINKTTGFLLLQAFLGSNSILFVFFSLRYLEIGDSIVIGTSAPVFVTFVAWVFLKEKCGAVPIISAFIALIGVGIICKPPILTGQAQLGSGTLKGVAYSMASMFLLTFCYVIIRFLRKVHHALVQLAFALWGLLESAVLGLTFGVIMLPQNMSEVGLIVGSAIFAFSAQTSLTLALKYEHAGVVALVRTTEVMFCYLWQVIFLHDDPDMYSIIGAVITLACVVVAALRKAVMSLEENHQYRKIFAFLLY